MLFILCLKAHCITAEKASLKYSHHSSFILVDTNMRGYRLFAHSLQLMTYEILHFLIRCLLAVMGV